MGPFYDRQSIDQSFLPSTQEAFIMPRYKTKTSWPINRPNPTHILQQTKRYSLSWVYKLLHLHLHLYCTIKLRNFQASQHVVRKGDHCHCRTRSLYTLHPARYRRHFQAWLLKRSALGIPHHLLRAAHSKCSPRGPQLRPSNKP